MINDFVSGDTIEERGPCHFSPFESSDGNMAFVM